MTKPTWKNPVVKWIDHRLPIFTFIDHSAIQHPTPRNLNYFWNFGSLLGFILVVMIASGIILSTYNIEVCLASVRELAL